MREKILQVDFNAWHFICNMQCQYCIEHYDFLEKDGELLIKKKGEKTYKFYAKIEHLFVRARKSLLALNEKYEASLLTFSGSEPLLFKKMIDLIKFAAGLFPRVQVITNGINLDDSAIKELEKIDNVFVSLSLDGHTIETNYSRTVNDKDRFSKIMKALQLLAKSKLQFNIYTVVTKYNIEHIDEFFNYLSSLKEKCSIQVWPVFGSNSLAPREDQVKALDKVIEEYDNYNASLQPKKYFEQLAEYLKSKKRKIPCSMPRCSMYLRDDGTIQGCLCNGLIELGNINSNNVEEINKVKDKSELFKKIPLTEGHICEQCFINWDVVNMYINGDIDLEELQSVELYNYDEFKATIKEFYIKGGK